MKSPPSRRFARISRRMLFCKSPPNAAHGKPDKITSGRARFSASRCSPSLVAQPSITLARGNFSAIVRASAESLSTAAKSAPSRRFERISPVNAPVPGPSSSTQSAFGISEAATIARAKNGDDGQSAPTEPGDFKNAFTNRSDMPAKVGSRHPPRNSKRDFPFEPPQPFAIVPR